MFNYFLYESYLKLNYNKLKVVVTFVFHEHTFQIVRFCGYFFFLLTFYAYYIVFVVITLQVS